MRVKIGHDEYEKDRNGTLRRCEPKPISKRRRRILGYGRKTPNQLRHPRRIVATGAYTITGTVATALISKPMKPVTPGRYIITGTAKGS